MEPKLRPLANQPKQLGYLMTRSSCWAVAFALQALVLPVLGIARDGQVCESSGGRSVTFTTTEATEMSLDISPHGQTLVFDRLGDLYQVPVDGRNLNRSEESRGGKKWVSKVK